MIKPIVVFIFWLLTLGIFDVHIKWEDGWSIKLYGWPGAIARWQERRKNARTNH